MAVGAGPSNGETSGEGPGARSAVPPPDSLESTGESTAIIMRAVPLEKQRQQQQQQQHTQPPGGAPAGSGAPYDGGEEPPGRVRIWFRALFRALAWMLGTLVVLGLIGAGGDVVLHRETHTSHEQSSYQDIYAVNIVLDGDGTVSVNGVPGGHAARLTESDVATYASSAQRTVSLVGSTLYIVVNCPNSFCSAAIALAVNPGTSLNITDGNAVRDKSAAISINGMNAPVDVMALPANLSVMDSSSTVTGVVFGSLTCRAPANCSGVAVP
jgi:hypothetical protein